MKFIATKHRLIVDQDGECKLTLSVPQTEAAGVMQIESQKLLRVTIEYEDAN